MRIPCRRTPRIAIDIDLPTFLHRKSVKDNPANQEENPDVMLSVEPVFPAPERPVNGWALPAP